ncbi:hypothetical protein BBD32_02645 [Elizabethkingia anophelis]|uniref:DNA methylase n=2 Tax=Elizabethkingia anophelis TaxID=1117645 RepID=A0AAU8V6F8_9FLAO|nr:hypothetical protein BBD32_02645 [Elizabethkingia anophelis]OPB66206.1 hypothetical protein BAY11_14675 [Elizabethkingia anophelis]
MKTMKIKQAETRVVKRSQITFASYNPRVITDSARKKLKANLKKYGLLGGIVWNEKTGNLVAGHQKLSIIDEANKYNPETKENDYEIRVEVVQMEQKQEIEQNIFMNNPSAQGEYDNDMLAQLLKDIDVDAAGLDVSDLNVIVADAPVFDVADFNQTVKGDFDKLEQKTEEEKQVEKEEKKQAIKEAKAQTKEKIRDEVDGDPWVTVSFTNFQNKAFFMELLGYPTEDRIIKGEPLTDIIEQLQ